MTYKPPHILALFRLPLYTMGIIVTAYGIFMLAAKKSLVNLDLLIFCSPKLGLPKIALEGISLAALAAAILLEIQPNGIIMLFGTPPGVEARPHYYS